MTFEFLDSCETSDRDAAGAGVWSSVTPSPYSPGDVSAERLPQPRDAWARGGDFTGMFDQPLVAALEQSAASGEGLRTMMGSGNGSPPPTEPTGGDGGRDGGAGAEIMALIGAGFLYAAVDRVLNKEKSDNASALLFAVLGGSLVYYGRKG